MTGTVEQGVEEAASRQAVLAEAVAGGPQPSGWPIRVVVAGLLAVMAVQMISAARHDTATYDEPVNVRSGMVYVLNHDLTPNPEHPPLTKLLSGWSVDLLRPDPRGDLASFRVIYFPEAPKYGKRVQALDERAQAAVRAGRVPLILLTLLFGLVVYLFARDLFGRLAGVVAVAVYALSPELIAHGHLATNDLPAAGFVMTALWCTLRVLRDAEPGIRRRWLVGAGLALGAGLATKYQVLAYSPAVAVAVGFVAWRSLPPGSACQQRVGRGVKWCAVLVAVSIAVVWTVTLVADPHALFHAPPTGFGHGDHSFIARLLSSLPLPAVYRAGLRYQNAYSNVPKPGFLLGEQYWGHKFWYQPLVLSMKYPIAVVGLWLAGVVAVVRRRNVVAVVLVVLPAAVVIGLAMAKGADIGDRYVIGTPVLLALTAGGVFAPGTARWLDIGNRRQVGAGLVVALLAFSTVAARGHELAYVNRLWGGTDRGYQLVSNSAVDWGQDLGRLAAWLRDNAGDRPVYIDYFGMTEPAAYGIEATPVDAFRAALVSNGIIAVSATEYDQNRALYDGLGPPAHVIGGSILIFDVRR